MMKWAIIMSSGRLLAIATLWVNACIFVGLFLTWFAPELNIPVVLGQLSSDANGSGTILAIAVWTSLLAISQLMSQPQWREDVPKGIRE
jgi:hypothetical protein